MKNSDLSNPIDALIERMPSKRAIELAEKLSVNRKTLYKWRIGKPISQINQLRLNTLCLSVGLPPMFKELAAKKSVPRGPSEKRQ